MKTAVALLVMLLCQFGAWPQVVGVKGDSDGGEGETGAEDDQTRPIANPWRRLQLLETMMRNMKTDNAGLKTRLDDLEKVNEDRPNVAFSAAMNDLVSTIGTIDEEATEKRLTYDEVTTNTGDYDSTTGDFTAPRDGLYFFRVTARYLRDSFDPEMRTEHRPKHVDLRHNKSISFCSSCGANIIMFDSERSFDDITFHNFQYGVHLQMKQGEKVYVMLPAHSSVYDSTFSGHLLAS